MGQVHYDGVSAEQLVGMAECIVLANPLGDPSTLEMPLDCTNPYGNKVNPCRLGWQSFEVDKCFKGGPGLHPGTRIQVAPHGPSRSMERHHRYHCIGIDESPNFERFEGELREGRRLLFLVHEVLQYPPSVSPPSDAPKSLWALAAVGAQADPGLAEEVQDLLKDAAEARRAHRRSGRSWWRRLFG
jgi:hypothetical protein